VLDRLRLYRLERRLERVERDYHKRYEDRKRKGIGKPEDDYGLQPDWMFDTGFLSEEIENLFTNSLISEARRLRVPVPPRDENEWWTRQQYTRGWTLTEEGIARIRAAVRLERKERREAILAWAPLVSALTGLIGVVMAFTLAVTRK
jgi:hypothetical protein